MGDSDDRLRVLKLVQEGKLTAEEGMVLLNAMGSSTPSQPDKTPPPAPPPSGKTARWLRVTITDVDTGKVRLNMRMPISLVSTGIKMGAKFSPEVDGLDMNHLQSMIQSGETGRVVDVYDYKDGERVEVFIE